MSVPSTFKNIKLNSDFFNQFLEVCSSLLYYNENAKETLEYLNSRVSKEAQNIFSFGYFPDEKNINLLFKYFDKQKLESLGLINKWFFADSDKTSFLYKGSLENHNLIMPYKDAYGNIIALIGRNILNDENKKQLEQDRKIIIPKYKTTKFCKSVSIFSIDKALKHILQKDNVLIVEGQLDCINGYSNGIKNIVALGGVSLTPYQFSTLRRYTKNINLLLDNDDSGISGTEKIINKYGKFSNIKKINLPKDIKDLDEYIKKGYDIYDIINQL